MADEPENLTLAGGRLNVIDGRLAIIEKHSGLAKA